MNRKLKIALRRRSSEQGFAIPIAVGMGLVMLLVGVTMIVRSQGTQVTASAQKATARSLSAAETGITRTLSLLNQNRQLAVYTACKSWKASGECDDLAAIKNWSSAPITSEPASAAWQK